MEDQGVTVASLPHLSPQVLKHGPSAPLVRVNFTRHTRHSLYALWLLFLRSICLSTMIYCSSSYCMLRSLPALSGIQGHRRPVSAREPGSELGISALVEKREGAH